MCFFLTDFMSVQLSVVDVVVASFFLQFRVQTVATAMHATGGVDSTPACRDVVQSNMWSKRFVFLVDSAA